MQFRSFLLAVVLMLAIPLEGLGSIGALWLRDMAWSPPVLWGMVVLAGVVLSNSILMVDKIQQLRGRGVPRTTAIVAASTLRLRPVLMTAFAAGAAMVPIALDPPPATEQFRNIATAISGGLLTSTVMTLVVIPIAYALMDDATSFVRRIYGLPPSAADTPPSSPPGAPGAEDGGGNEELELPAREEAHSRPATASRE